MKKTNVAFGTGICMQNNWKLIEKYFAPEYLSDNAPEKWHTFPMKDQRECVSPEEVRKLPNPYVLITIGDPYAIDAVKKQFSEMNIPCEAITSYLDQWGEKEALPEHLKALERPRDRKRMLLFNSPEHDNVGDHLISIAELKFIQERFPEYECIEITDIEYLWFHNRIREYVAKDDLVLITGGGFLGSLWLYNGELNVRSVIEEYPDNKIVIMPQTLYFEEGERGKREKENTIAIYRRHQNLTVCLREQNSYSMLQGMLGEQVRMALVPDMALSLNYSDTQKVRKGALLCIRKDKESVLDEAVREKVIAALERRGIGYDYTLMHTGNCFNIDTRTDEIEQKAMQMKTAEIVVTDTLHGMILCAITGTPCLAFDNLSHKVSGVYAWIEKLSYIHLHNEGEDVDKYISELLEQGAGNYEPEEFVPYYEELARMIGE